MRASPVEGRPTLVFVHGWACDRSYWDAQVEHFSARHRVLAVDLDRREWTMAAFGQDVVASVNAAGLDDLVLIGHSMGGNVILQAARGLAGRVRGLIWVDTYRSLVRFADDATVQKRLAPFREDFVAATQAFVRSMFPASADPELVDRIAAAMSSAPPDVAVKALENAWSDGPNAIATMAELRLPHAAVNAGYKPTDADSLARHGVKAFVVPGTGHFLMLEQPIAFNGFLSDAIEYIAGLWTYS